MLARERGADQLFQGANFVEHLIAAAPRSSCCKGQQFAAAGPWCAGDGHDGREEMQQGSGTCAKDSRFGRGCATGRRLPTPMANVSHNSGDLHRISAQSGNPKTFANWIVFAESVPRQVFVDYDNQLNCRCGHLRQRSDRSAAECPSRPGNRALRRRPARAGPDSVEEVWRSSSNQGNYVAFLLPRGNRRRSAAWQTSSSAQARSGVASAALHGSSQARKAKNSLGYSTTSTPPPPNQARSRWPPA